MEKVKQIFTIMLTFLGTPCIYYGDEIGFTGTQDPGCRKCMEWDETKQNRELFDHIQRLIHLRKQYPLLANEGEFSFVTPHEDDVCLAYTKTNGEKTAIVIVNTSNAEQSYTLPGISSGKKVKNLWNDEEVVVSQTNHVVSLTANGFAILEY